MLVTLTSGCAGTATPGSTTTGSTTSASTAAQNRQGLKFDRVDLVVNRISQGATATETFQSLGSPVQQEKTVEEASGRSLLTCEYDGLVLEFVGEGTALDQLHLRSAEATSPQYEFARSLKVGDAMETVVQAFFQDANVTQFEEYEGFTVLYGDPDAMLREDEAGDISFGYHNDDLAYYQSMTPPYMGAHATIYDEASIIQFVFTDRRVSLIRWSFGPGAE